jgi:hypothetical protein
MSPNSSSTYIVRPVDAHSERACRAWARLGGIVCAIATLVSMAYSAEWNVRMVLSDPLAWMTTLVAIAAGLVGGYALGVHLHVPTDE